MTTGSAAVLKVVHVCKDLEEVKVKVTGMAWTKVSQLNTEM